MRTQVEVVAVGARTPVGFTAENSAASVRAGITRYAEYPFIAPHGEPVVVAADRLLEPEVEGRDRLMPMAESVIEELEGKLGQGILYKSRLSVLLALAEARPGFSEDDAAWVANALAAHLRAKTSNARVEIAGRGHAGALLAVEQAVRECSESRDNLFLIVGVDSCYHAATFDWLERGRRFAQSGVRGGFTPGEGAGCLALISAGLRRRLHLPQLAIVRGVCTAREARLRDSETGSLDVGMMQAVQGAVAGLESTASATAARSGASSRCVHRRSASRPGTKLRATAGVMWAPRPGRWGASSRSSPSHGATREAREHWW